MTDHFHAIVWIDHHQARIFHFNDDAADQVTVHASNPHSHIHHKANAGDSGHAPEDQVYLHAVVKAIATAGAILLTGPGGEKHELLKHVERHDADLAKRISAVETLDHPTDGELLAHARRYFKAADRMASQRA